MYPGQLMKSEDVFPGGGTHEVVVLVCRVEELDEVVVGKGVAEEEIVTVVLDDTIEVEELLTGNVVVVELVTGNVVVELVTGNVVVEVVVTLLDKVDKVVVEVEMVAVDDVNVVEEDIVGLEELVATALIVDTVVNELVEAATVVVDVVETPLSRLKAAILVESMLFVLVNDIGLLFFNQH